MIAAAPSAMKTPRRMIAMMMPIMSADCWSFCGHLEAGHDEQEDEEVVDRQGVLGQPAGVELTGVLAAPLEPHEEAEEHGRRDVEGQDAGPPRPSTGRAGVSR